MKTKIGHMIPCICKRPQCHKARCSQHEYDNLARCPAGAWYCQTCHPHYGEGSDIPRCGRCGKPSSVSPCGACCL